MILVIRKRERERVREFAVGNEDEVGVAGADEVVEEARAVGRRQEVRQNEHVGRVQREPRVRPARIDEQLREAEVIETRTQNAGRDMN
jgi:hypothetical protein